MNNDFKAKEAKKRNTVIEILKLLEGFPFSDSEAILTSALGVLRGIAITKLPDDIHNRVDDLME